MSARRSDHLMCRGGALTPPATSDETMPSFDGGQGRCPAPTIFLIFVASIAWARSQSAVRAFNEGVTAFNAKQFNQAIPHFDDAIAADSNFTEAYFARGACKYYLKAFDTA